MNAPRSSFASLKPALLARKGGARPAMRPQLAALDRGADADLGWNDFGSEADAGDRVVSIRRAVAKPARRGRAEPADRTAGRADGRADGRRAAFTLRLDPERHLKLRLACTLDSRSAQALVTEALDRLLGAMPELEPLAVEAAGLRGGAKRRTRRPAKA
jgi:hypothetical protein